MFLMLAGSLHFPSRVDGKVCSASPQRSKSGRWWYCRVELSGGAALAMTLDGRVSCYGADSSAGWRREGHYKLRAATDFDLLSREHIYFTRIPHPTFQTPHILVQTSLSRVQPFTIVQNLEDFYEHTHSIVSALSQCQDKVPHIRLPRQGMSQHTVPAAPSVVQPTQMRIGQRSQILPSEEGYKTESLKEIIVSTPGVVSGNFVPNTFSRQEAQETSRRP